MGRPLVLLNGTGSPAADWDPVLLGRLAVNQRVIVFDYPGLGQSRPAPSRITMQSMADWTAEFIGAIGLDHPDILGWSMGGFVAQQILIRHPGLVRRAILAGTNPGGKSAKLGPRWAQEIDSATDGDLNDYYKTNYSRNRCGVSAGRSFVRRVNRAVDDGRYPDPRVPNKTFRAMVRAENPWLRSNRNFDALASINTPTMVMFGALDVVTPQQNSKIIAGRIPNASFTKFRGAGHSFLFQDPDLVANRIRDFWEPEQTPAAQHHVIKTRCL